MTTLTILLPLPQPTAAVAALLAVLAEHWPGVTIHVTDSDGLRIDLPEDARRPPT